MFAIETYQEHVRLVENVKRVHRKALADAFIAKADKFFTTLARKAILALNLKLGDLDDLKNDLVIKTYELAEMFDEERGIPFDKYVGATLKFHLYSNRTQAAYFHTIAGKPTTMLSEYTKSYSRGDREVTNFQLVDKKEISSLEVAADVFKHIQGLDAHDQLLIDLVFVRGMQYKQIEESLGTAHGTVWHRMRRILNTIQSSTSCQQESDNRSN